MLSRKKKNQMRKAFKINLINLFPPVCYVSVISPPLWKKEMLNWKAVLTWGWTAALFLPLEDKNTHRQEESRRVMFICQISFHPCAWMWQKTVLTHNPLSKWDRSLTFLHTDDEGMRFVWEESAVTIDQVSQVLGHGQRCRRHRERLQTHANILILCHSFFALYMSQYWKK